MTQHHQRALEPEAIAPRTQVASLWAIAMAIAVTGAGCASGPRYFEPAERVQGQTVQGYRIAIYPLQGPQGSFGEAKIWSRGAHENGDRTRVHVGFELHNTSGAPITMDGNDIRLDVRTGSGDPIKAIAPAAGQAHSVAAGALGEVDWLFELPQGLQPGDVDALRVHWRVNTATQSYEQRTPFVRETWYAEPVYVPPPYAYPCWPYGPYDCAYGLGLPWFEPIVIQRGIPIVPVERRVTRSYPKR